VQHLLQAHRYRWSGTDNPADRHGSDVRRTLEDSLPEFDHVISLARYPNLALKWCHAPDRISAEAYPFHDLAPYARRLIDAFGAERVMWASVYTQVQQHHSWAQALHHIMDWHILSETEAEWIFGRTIRTILRWPRTPPPG